MPAARRGGEYAAGDFECTRRLGVVEEPGGLGGGLTHRRGRLVYGMPINLASLDPGRVSEKAWASNIGGRRRASERSRCATSTPREVPPPPKIPSDARGEEGLTQAFYTTYRDGISTTR